MSVLTSRTARLKRSLRDGGLGLLVTTGGLALVIAGGAFGIFIGIPLVAGGGLALGFGLVGLARYGLIPGRKAVCPRCATEQSHLRDLPFTPCVECGLPLVFAGSGKPRHTTCKRCGAAFGVAGSDGDEAACPDCGRLHQLSGGEVFERAEAERLPTLDDFVPGGPLFGDAAELRRSVRSPAGEVIWAGRLTTMLAGQALTVVWGELAARTRALDEALAALQRALNAGELKAAPEYWNSVEDQAARVFDGWSRYLELAGPLELRGAEVETDFPVGRLIRRQHKLAGLPGFGDRWSLEAAAMAETDRWLAPNLYTVADHRPLRELARNLRPALENAAVEREEYDALLERFSVGRLSASRRARLTRALEIDPGRIRAAADLSHSQNASAGLALLDDGRLAFWGSGKPRFFDRDDIEEVYFKSGALRLEVAGERFRLSKSAPRDERAFLFLIHTPPPPPGNTKDDPGEAP